MEDEERQKKLEAGKAKVREPEAPGGSWARGGRRWLERGGRGPGKRRSQQPWFATRERGASGPEFYACPLLSFFPIEKAWCYYLADDTSVMIGWCGFFLVNAQIKPFLYCIAISWYSLLLNLQPFTVVGSFLGSAGIVLFRVGI